MSKQKFITAVTNIEHLTQLLQSSKQPYLLETELPAAKVYFKFIGVFMKKPIVWNACVQTIEDYARFNTVEKDPMQFIEILVKDGAHFVGIGLNIDSIDKAAVERTILMIRNYKRLKEGRHEFGARSKTLQPS